MTMHDIGFGLRRASRYVACRRDVAQAQVPAHLYPAHSERELGGKLGKALLRPRTAGRCIGDKAHAVTVRNLPARKVEHMAEKPAYRCAQDVQDIESAAHRQKVCRDEFTFR